MKRIIFTTISIYIFFLLGCSKDSDNTTPNIPSKTIPIITSVPINLITKTTATGGGNITKDGGSAITARGVVWSTNPNPSINLESKTSDGNGSGIYQSNISGLLPNTKYYVRAFATNIIGTAYGDELNFSTLQIDTVVTQIDTVVTKIDAVVTICNETWMVKNLDVSTYRNGDIIPQVSDMVQWETLTTGAWCYYNNDPALGAIYGKIYNAYAVMDLRGLAPQGWHVASHFEWNHLMFCLGGGEVAGAAIKEAGTVHWQSPNEANNSSGFTALPGGHVWQYMQHGYQSEGIGFGTTWWASTWDPRDLATWSNSVSSDLSSIAYSMRSPNNGFYVRCVKN